MKIEKRTDGEFLIEASADELLLLNNALNEICNGLPIRDFDTRVGVSLPFAERVLRDVGDALDRSAAH